MRRPVQALLLVAAAALLAGCASDKPKPTPLEAVTAQIAGRPVWNAKVDSVQFPLALPVFLRSLRVVMVQTVGMAVIAALIGAGGFGALVFQGLLSSAVDLVLLGVIPVVVLAVLIDALFDLGLALLKVSNND